MFSLVARRGMPAFVASGRQPLAQASSIGSLLQRQRFASAAASKVAQVLQAEVKHEEEQYEQPKEIKDFLKGSDFKFVEEAGDVNMMLERDFGNKVARIEWQLTSPYAPDGEMEEDDAQEDSTDFVVTVEDKEGSAGLSFYCSTQGGEDHRYIIGNVKNYSSAEEKEGVTSYNGPDFEDVDDKLQEAFDEYLADVGLNSEVCDFIDATATDKEQKEYIRWLQISHKFLNA
jgi:complement component 1 Q subcomponent-binding protein